MVIPEQANLFSKISRRVCVWRELCDATHLAIKYVNKGKVL